MNPATSRAPRSPGNTTADGPAGGRFPGAPLSSRRAVGLVARREIRSRTRTKSFVFGTAGLLLVLGLYALLPLFAQSGPAVVGLDDRAAALRPALESAAREAGESYRFEEVGGGAEELLRTGELSAVVTGPPGSPGLVVEHGADPELLAAVRTAAERERTVRELREAGVDPAELARSVGSTEVRVTALEPARNGAAEQFVLVLASTGLLYFFFVLLGLTLAQGVVEEKSSRVVELLLSTIRPWQLLAGKTIGVAVVGLAQFLLLGGAGAALAETTGLLRLPAAVGGTLLALGVWFVLGFLLFAALLAAAAARVSRQEDLQAVVQPVMVLITAPFVLGLVLLTDDPHAPVIEWLSLLPPFSPVLMPARMVLGTADAWQVALSLLLAGAALVLLTRLAGRVYAGSVLHNGARLSIKEALRRR
ncbi:ABC transporter permease [Streptomyces xinghaiensis]|uniref:ABC transporter permease n=1 Tax=Streptomyces xinghaiensis TaxID=1038928 RepID=UPI002E157281|nr:ABC transporter permease [Streptomyces xinghaiensis]